VMRARPGHAVTLWKIMIPSRCRRWSRWWNPGSSPWPTP
jgi:hypothetical protein